MPAYSLLPLSGLRSSSRRHRIILALMTTSALLLATIYLQTDRLITFPLLPPQRAPIHNDLDPEVGLGANHDTPRLWAYVYEQDHGEARADAWEWVAKQRVEGYRRPSWGGLRQQGPKAHVRDNLKDGELYITTFPEAGFNNEVIESCNLIAVALRSNRIPILSPLLPDYLHLKDEREAFLSVTEIFDFTDFIARYNVPVIDMMELKVGQQDWIPIAERHRSVVFDGEHPQGSAGGRDGLAIGNLIRAEEAELDELKCWNTYLAVDDDRGEYVSALWPVTFEDTPLPLSAYTTKSHNLVNEISLPRTAQAVAAYSKQGDLLPDDSIARMAQLGLKPSTMVPNDPFGCIHRAYYLHMNPEIEDVHDDWRNGIGAWDEVGRYLKFQPGLVRLAEDLTRSLLDVQAGEEIPPYLAIHIRRTDFGNSFNATQRQWAHQAWALRQRAATQHNIHVEHIVFTTDEENESWLKELRDLGWIHVDHKKAQTGERLGGWFPTILDSIILSSAKIFLGVPTSTMSILPYRRVLDWNGGVAQFVTALEDAWKYEVPPEWEWTDES